MTALIEIIIDGVKKFGGEIIAAILLAIAFGIFPRLRKLFGKKNASDEEVKQRLEQLQSVLGLSSKLCMAGFSTLLSEICLAISELWLRNLENVITIFSYPYRDKASNLPDKCNRSTKWSNPKPGKDETDTWQ